MILISVHTDQPVRFFRTCKSKGEFRVISSEVSANIPAFVPEEEVAALIGTTHLTLVQSL